LHIARHNVQYLPSYHLIC